MLSNIRVGIYRAIGFAVTCGLARSTVKSMIGHP